MKKNIKNRESGFTLVELLITVAIIGILAAIVLVNLNSSRKQSRDVKRVADIREILTAMQLFFNDNGAYPLPDTPSTTGPTSTDGDPAWSTFMVAWPNAPIPPDNPVGVTTCDATNNLYTYSQTNGGADFEITFCLGEQIGQYGPGTHTLTSTGIQ